MARVGARSQHLGKRRGQELPRVLSSLRVWGCAGCSKAVDTGGERREGARQLRRKTGRLLLRGAVTLGPALEPGHQFTKQNPCIQMSFFKLDFPATMEGRDLFFPYTRNVLLLIVATGTSIHAFEWYIHFGVPSFFLMRV